MANNLSRRPAKPALGRGRIQQGARRAFTMLDSSELSTSQILPFTHALRLHQGRSIDTNTYRQVHRRLSAIADRQGRSSSRGRPWIWRLREKAFSLSLAMPIGHLRGYLRHQWLGANDRKYLSWIETN